MIGAKISNPRVTVHNSYFYFICSNNCGTQFLSQFGVDRIFLMNLTSLYHLLTFKRIEDVHCIVHI